MTRSDQIHINTAYALIHEALNEMCQVLEKDRPLAEVHRKLYTMEDTLYQYRTKEANHER